jgi:Protein of unknown function (DUF559)
MPQARKVDQTITAASSQFFVRLCGSHAPHNQLKKILCPEIFGLSGNLIFYIWRYQQLNCSQVYFYQDAILNKNFDQLYVMQCAGLRLSPRKDLRPLRVLGTWKTSFAKTLRRLVFHANGEWKFHCEWCQTQSPRNTALPLFVAPFWADGKKRSATPRNEEQTFFPARGLRRKSAAAETKLWQHLRNRQLNGAKFLGQMSIDPFVTKFVCRKVKLVIEIDGATHETAE